MHKECTGYIELCSGFQKDMKRYYLTNTMPTQTAQEQATILQNIPKAIEKICMQMNFDAISLFENFMIVRKHSKLGIINDCGIIIVPVKMSVIIPPVKCQRKLFCIKDAHSKWGATDERGQVVVPFGTYHNMWGFDTDYCLVDNGSDETHFTDRAIINSNAEIVIGYGKYTSIWDFYAKPYSSIVAERAEMKYYLSKTNPSIIIKEERNIIND